MHVLSWPAIYSLELTPACNNRCPGCSNVYRAARRPAATDAATWERWLAEFGPEAVQMRLTGGEPTLHPEFLRILTAATSYDAWVSVFTNGRWREPVQLVRQLAGWPRLSGLLISLHGACAESHEAFSRVAGSFAETTANIRFAVAHGVPVALSTILTRQSCPEVEAVVALGHDLGVQHIAFNRYLSAPDPRIEPTLDQFRAAMRAIEAFAAAGEPVKYGIGLPQCFCDNSSEGCLAGVAYVAVDPWGHVHPCAHSPAMIGSLHERSLVELWHSPRMDVWRGLMPAECTGCTAYARCHGGCRAVQEVRPDGRDPLRRTPLAQYRPPAAPCPLPASAYPTADVRLRPEAFGYVALGRGQFLPVHAAARPVIEACDGRQTFAQLAAMFGQAGLELLGELWQAGMLSITDAPGSSKDAALRSS